GFGRDIVIEQQIEALHPKGLFRQADMDLASEIEILLALGVAHGAAGNKPAPFAALFGQEPGAIVQLARLQRVYGLRRSEQIAAVDGGVGHAYPGVIDTVSNGHGQKNHRHDGSAHNASTALELFVKVDIGTGSQEKNQSKLDKTSS